MAGQPGHKWFAAFWEWQNRHEPAAVRRWRQETAGGARGRVLEIGCGAGANFGHYDDAVTEIIATDPDPYMLERAKKRATALSRHIDIRTASAQELPFEDGSFDTVVSTVNMCSVQDAPAALGEVRRVLRPGGEYRFFDHVRYESAVGALFQDLVTPLWVWAGGGCHPNRDVGQMIRDSGLEIVQMERLHGVPPIPPFIVVRPVIKGVAVRR
jgi:ubiquinone/menaquinone biosynthesis C-methylase UbiE